jgi:cell division protein FtsZ
MGGGTGTGAAPVIARAAREHGILTVGVVTKPFHFEGAHRMRLADQGIEDLSQYVDTLIIIPNQNLFRIANPKTTFAEAFQMADDVLHSGVRGVTDLMVMPGLINLDFADIRTVMSEMGKAMMGTGEAEGEDRAIQAAEAAISNPLLDDVTMKGAKGVLINITGGMDITLFEVDEAAQRVSKEVDADANIIFGSTFDEAMQGRMRVSVVATGIDIGVPAHQRSTVISLVEPTRRPAPNLANLTGRAPTLAERVAAAERVFVAPAIVPAPAPAPVVATAPTQPQPEPMVVEAVAELEAAVADRASAAAPAPAAAPLALADHGAPVTTTPAAPPVDTRITATTQEPAVPVRTEPTLVIRSTTPPRPVQPMQGSLPIGAPAPRSEPRVEIRAEPRPQPRVEQPAAAVSEPHRRGFISRLAGHVRQATQQAAAQDQHQGEAPARRIEAAPAAAAMPQATRIGPADRLPTSRTAEEDLLDIPAFLRRQAN